MNECIVCGKQFEPLSKKGVFCSVNCKQKDYRERIAEIVRKARIVSAKVTKVDGKHNLQVKVSIPEVTAAPQSDLSEQDRLLRIRQLEYELTHVPTNLIMSKRIYVGVREQELNQLRNEK